MSEQLDAYLVCPCCDVRLFELWRTPRPGSEEVFFNELVPLRNGLTEADRKACVVCKTNLERRSP